MIMCPFVLISYLALTIATSFETINTVDGCSQYIRNSIFFDEFDLPYKQWFLRKYKRIDVCRKRRTGLLLDKTEKKHLEDILYDAHVYLENDCYYHGDLFRNDSIRSSIVYSSVFDTKYRTGKYYLININTHSRGGSAAILSNYKYYSIDEYEYLYTIYDKKTRLFSLYVDGVVVDDEVAEAYKHDNRSFKSFFISLWRRFTFRYRIKYGNLNCILRFRVDENAQIELLPIDKLGQ